MRGGAVIAVVAAGERAEEPLLQDLLEPVRGQAPRLERRAELRDLGGLQKISAPSFESVVERGQFEAARSSDDKGRRTRAFIFPTSSADGPSTSIAAGAGAGAGAPASSPI